jgi:Flp pilus assembly protein CpaB
MAEQTTMSDDRTVARAGRRGGATRRRFGERAVLPNGRALLGGLLLALAAVGTFLTWQWAAGTPDTTYVVTRHPLRAGQRLGEDDLALAAADLPGALAVHAFADPASVVGRVVLGPVGEGELVQASQLSDASSAPSTVEVALSLPRDRALDGALQPGDRVDAFVTYDDRTLLVVARAQVLAISGGDAAAIGDLGQVTVTVALPDTQPRAELVHAARRGEVTLVRSTQADADVDPGSEVFVP